MIVTVAICTWNRAALLDETLALLRSLEIPAEVEWELVVVNNNCTDGTDEVIGRHAGALPIRRYFEPEPGLSNARNCALAAARGDLVLWTDDDVVVDPGWVAAYVRAARRWPEAAYFGGPIRPRFEESPPPWILENQDGLLAGVLGKIDLGPNERPFDTTEQPFGANFALRPGALDRRRFDPRLGCRAGRHLNSEESDFIARLQEAGMHGVWVADARVEHRISSKQLSDSYIKSFFFDSGRTTARRSGPRGRPSSLEVVGLHRRRWELAAKAWLKRLLRYGDWRPNMLRSIEIAGIISEFSSRAEPGPT